MKPILTYAKMSIKRMLRDKTALFFVFLFPVIFLMVFGLIFKTTVVELSRLQYLIALIQHLPKTLLR
jgi:hypothetical protein